MLVTITFDPEIACIFHAIDIPEDVTNIGDIVKLMISEYHTGNWYTHLYNNTLDINDITIHIYRV